MGLPYCDTSSLLCVLRSLLLIGGLSNLCSRCGIDNVVVVAVGLVRLLLCVL